MNEIVRIWARGMAEIFTNAKSENVTAEIDMLLESLGLEPRTIIRHWTDKI